MFDRSLVDQVECEFIVIGDTHAMLPDNKAAEEKSSRLLQTHRTAVAYELATALKPGFVVHLGDLVQEFPGSPGFNESMLAALAAIERTALEFRFVAGNHDVGDKPDPTMPADWATPAALAAYHKLVGHSWYSWNESGWHFIVLNSQIMNSGLEAEQLQREWLRNDLASHQGLPSIVFLHMAPFLHNLGEPGLGHYDNIGEPARSWLIQQLAMADVRLIFTGHSHFQFFNRLGSARIYGTPSVSFTRPGFSELFSAAAPPEQGRNDTPKLGFFLVQIHRHGPRVHLIRTRPDSAVDLASGEQHVLTRPTADLPDSPLGVQATHQLAPGGAVPLAWPSMVRQPVRNDYPFLACLELGVRHLAVPASDLIDRAQAKRIQYLREEGVQVRASWLWSPDLDLMKELAPFGGSIDGAEILLPGILKPEPELLRAVLSLEQVLGAPVGIAPLMPREIVPGKQHARARIGYRVSELQDLDQHLDRYGLYLQRASCRVDVAEGVWDGLFSARGLTSLKCIGSIDWNIGLTTLDEREQGNLVAEAMLGGMFYPGCRLFIEPFTDLDRTMDVSLGLLDRQCNPRSAFTAMRLLNSILYGAREADERVETAAVHSGDDGREIELITSYRRLIAFLPGPTVDRPATLRAELSPDPGKQAQSSVLYDLQRGVSRRGA